MNRICCSRCRRCAGAKCQTTPTATCRLMRRAKGYTGSIAGEKPYSWLKITFAVLGVLLLILAAPTVMSNSSG